MHRAVDQGSRTYDSRARCGSFL